MNALTESIAVLLVLTNLALLGLSRLGSCIRVVAVQGLVLGMLPLLTHGDVGAPRLWMIAVGSMVLKAIVFPRLLFRAIREANVSREVEPFIGYTASLFLGIAALPASLWLGARLPLPGRAIPALVIPVAFFTIFVGLLLLVSRRKAITQVLGYLVLENGIYTFGVAVVSEIPLLVELGVLLDGFVAVLVMGIAVFHINREFDHIDVDELNQLSH